jgi:hypothetical protein
MAMLRQIAWRQVDEFLSALFLPEELIELRFIESWQSHGKKRSRVVRAAQWLHRADVIATHAALASFARRTRANIYFGVNPRPKEGDADDQTIKTVRCVWCDVDNVDLDEARSRWTDAGIPQPSIVVSSGSGIHGYWLVEQDLHSPEDHSRLGAMLPCFYASFGGDHVQNLSRIMRLPGTFNYKEARNGRPPRTCTLCVCDPDVRYPLEAFSPWFEQAERGPSRMDMSMPSVTKAGVSPGEAQSRNADIAELIGRLQIPSRDRSRRDFAVICDLLRLGLAKENIWQLVAGSSKFESAGRPYFDLTITNAERRLCLDGTSARRVRVST